MLYHYNATLRGIQILYSKDDTDMDKYMQPLMTLENMKFLPQIDKKNSNIKASTHSVKSQNNHNMPIESKKLVYVSVGDINGIGLELILRNHVEITKYCKPVYCIDSKVLENAAQLLHIEIPNNMDIHPVNMHDISINVGEICAKSGLYSFKSFEIALELSIKHNADIVTLPIHKYAWQLAGVEYAGHTQYLRHRFQKEAIMMLGCKEMFVALYTDHIPLSKVADTIQREPLLQFFRDFYRSYSMLSISSKYPINFGEMQLEVVHDTPSHIADAQPQDSVKGLKIAVLGLNPHAGDNGVLGHEDMVINECIANINEEIGAEVFVGSFAPDSAFIPHNRQLYNVFIAMYHDSGLAPLKALYFDKSINVSLNLPILRTSPDHGTCFDKAYRFNNHINMNSYIESFKFLCQNSQYKM